MIADNKLAELAGWDEEILALEFAQASGEMSKEEFTAFLSSVCTQMANWSDDGSLHFVCMYWKQLGRQQTVRFLPFWVQNRK